MSMEGLQDSSRLEPVLEDQRVLGDKLPNDDLLASELVGFINMPLGMVLLKLLISMTTLIV